MKRKKKRMKFRNNKILFKKTKLKINKRRKISNR